MNAMGQDATGEIGSSLPHRAQLLLSLRATGGGHVQEVPLEVLGAQGTQPAFARGHDEVPPALLLNVYNQGGTDSTPKVGVLITLLHRNYAPRTWGLGVK
jgi:hypothetical protein